MNILLILGTSAVVTPLSLAGINIVDAIALLASMVLIWVFAYTGKRDKIDRWEGGILLLAYLAYMIFLFKKL